MLKLDTKHSFYYKNLKFFFFSRKNFLALEYFYIVATSINWSGKASLDK
jgi:hypothetical protein